MYVSGKNRTLWLVAGTVGGILLYDYIAKKVNTISKLSASVDSIQFGKFAFPNLEALIGLIVTNASDNDAVATSFAGNLVDEAGTVLGKFDVVLNQVTKIIIPKRPVAATTVPYNYGSARIDVNVNVNLLAAGTTLVQGQKVKLKGIVVIDNIQVPIYTDAAIGCACSDTN